MIYDVGDIIELENQKSYTITTCKKCGAKMIPAKRKSLTEDDISTLEDADVRAESAFANLVCDQCAIDEEPQPQPKDEEDSDSSDKDDDDDKPSSGGESDDGDSGGGSGGFGGFGGGSFGGGGASGDF